MFPSLFRNIPLEYSLESGLGWTPLLGTEAQLTWMQALSFKTICFISHMNTLPSHAGSLPQLQNGKKL